jgi:hypothetical protein
VWEWGIENFKPQQLTPGAWAAFECFFFFSFGVLQRKKKKHEKRRCGMLRTAGGAEFRAKRL